MAGRPSKTLRELVRDGTFLARRHGQLLTSQPVPWPGLGELQRLYQVATTDFERAATAREFEKAVRQAHAAAAAQADAEGPTLEQRMLKLGPHGSARQANRFFPTFLALEDGSPFKLQRWQQEVNREAIYKRHPDGRRVYKEILLGIARGNGKTPFATGHGLLNLLTSRFLTAALGQAEIPRVRQAAGSKQQASIGVTFANRWVNADESELQEWLRAKANRLELRELEGSYTIASADGRMAHGGKDTLDLLDEWWLLESAREEQVYIAFRSALQKIGDAFLLATTTAGYDKTSQLGEVYDAALRLPDVTHRREGFLTIARDPEHGFCMWWYGMPDGYELDLENDKAVLKALRLANPSSFVDVQALLAALRRPGCDVYEWMRLALNAWTATRDIWLPLGAFARLRTNEPIPDGADVYVAVDAALKHDTTAVVWAARVGDRIRMQGRAWAAREGAPAHERHAGGRIRNREIMEWIDRELGRRYNVREIVADPRFFDDYIYELGQRGYLVAEFAQNTGEMRDAEQHFFQRATAEPQELEWCDPDGVMAKHMDATSAKPTRSGFKVENPDKSRPIDLATGMIMASERCAIADRVPPSVYESRGLLFLETTDAVPSADFDDDDVSEAELARRMRAAMRDQDD